MKLFCNYRTLSWNALVFLTVTSAFGQQPSGELERIKAAIADAALEKSVSVVSNAYINADGRLVESTFFKAGAQLRGVRMPQFFNDEEPYQAQIQFADTAFNTNLGCDELAVHRYRKGVRLDLSFQNLAGMPGKEPADLLALLRETFQEVSEAIIQTDENLYLLPTSISRAAASSRYEASLRPRSNDIRNANVVLKFAVEDVRVVSFAPKQILEKAQSRVRTAGRWVGREVGMSGMSRMKSQRADSRNLLLDFKLVISMQGTNSVGEPSGDIFSDINLKVRFDYGRRELVIIETVQSRVSNITDSTLQTTKSIFDRSKLVMGQTRSLISNSVSFLSRRDRDESNRIGVSEFSGRATNMARAGQNEIISEDSGFFNSLQSVINSSTDLISCNIEELKLYSAVGTGPGSFKINQGEISGIEIGDKFIVSAARFSSSTRPITSSQLDNLAIGEVVRTSEYNSDFVITEGPIQTSVTLSATPF